MRDPKHILITGASSGIGASLALHYAALGIRLALHGRNNERLEKIASACRQRGAETQLLIGDVTDAAAMQSWIQACDNKQPLDLVIANAAISVGTAKGGETAEQITDVFATNVGGTFNTIQPALDFMKARRCGQIAIVSSVAGFRGLPGSPAYCASKAAGRIYGEGLRAEMVHYGVEVNVICPGFVKTPMTDVNQFHMPFLMEPQRAAAIIRQGLARNQARIAFPWQMYALIRLLTALPQPISDWICARMPKK